ncbi:RNA polymerase-binding protein Rnk [Citrifermentans bemidjiense Bem]|uniref:RNA polymerase-binding protein Rnk n=1 Tax=Citrifermentans bemidjiense (strain ATCC BAA-1014 / DSM 16622 / JCM 12645 / Bem) TaxID=404380 RepID=B5EI69_CITBB|nr:nucleoside diphosphate kinase regulator [Citrifermentans bemidjiense]ACH38333.1 RNA polymerase-binding protein Rnk [Citrifermentans bemidjiense Bem]
MKNTQKAQRQVVVTEFDMERLEALIDKARSTQTRDSKNLKELGEELVRAEVVDPAGIPPDVITMNSKVCLQDLDSEEELVYTLVFPNEADLASGKISILAPVGTAMIGFRTGDRITWPVPGGMKNLKVKKILYQPEAAGDYHL